MQEVGAGSAAPAPTPSGGTVILRLVGSPNAVRLRRSGFVAQRNMPEIGPVDARSSAQYHVTTRVCCGRQHRPCCTPQLPHRSPPPYSPPPPCSPCSSTTASALPRRSCACTSVVPGLAVGRGTLHRADRAAARTQWTGCIPSPHTSRCVKPVSCRRISHGPFQEQHQAGCDGRPAAAGDTVGWCQVSTSRSRTRRCDVAQCCLKPRTRLPVLQSTPRGAATQSRDHVCVMYLISPLGREPAELDRLRLHTTTSARPFTPQSLPSTLLGSRPAPRRLSTAVRATPVSLQHGARGGWVPLPSAVTTDTAAAARPCVSLRPSQPRLACAGR